MIPTLLILKNGQVLISESEEMDYEPKVHLIRPYEVSGKTKVTLTPWPSYTSDTDILLRSDDLLTVCEPEKSLLEIYLKKIGKTIKDYEEKIEEEKVLLNEQEELPNGDFDEYEPMYTEVN